MKKLIGVVAFLLWTNLLNAQIKEFFLTCNPTDFEYIYDNYEQDIYIPATLEFDGTVWSNVSIRIRGDGSRVYPKKSLKLRFNEGAYIDGRSSLNLNAEWEDQSYIQQFLASRIMQESGQYCFDTEHVRLYLNGSFLGLYLLIEAVDERYFQVRGLDPNGATYKAALDGSSLSVFDQPQFHWEQKTGPDVNMADLQLLIDQMNAASQESYGEFVNQVFEREEVVNIIALNVLLSLGSTYYHNYFMHHEPSANKWMMLPWDMDKTLLYYGSSFPYHRSSRTTEPDNPFHEKAIQDPQLLSEIRTRVETLQATVFNYSNINPIIDSVMTAIEPSVIEDATDDVTDVPFWQSRIDDYITKFNQRVSRLLQQIDEYPRSFTIERVGVAEPGTSIQINWTPSSSPLSRPISYRFTLSDHPNIEANLLIEETNITDTFVVASTPQSEGLYYYKVQAYDGFTYVDGFDTYNPIVVTSNVPELVINEINYHSSADHVSGDWVEIHNPLTYAVELENWYLKDDQNDHVFTLPSEASIGPGQFVILATDSASFSFLNDVNAPVYGGIDFGFGNSGDHLRLFHPSGVLVDEVFYSDTTPWPWQADGYGPTLELHTPELDNSLAQNWSAWEGRLGTPGAPNYYETHVGNLDNLTELSVYPNPSNGRSLTLELTVQTSEFLKVEVVDAKGKLVHHQNFKSNIGTNRLHILPNIGGAGIYLLRISGNRSSISSKIVVTEKHK